MALRPLFLMMMAILGLAISSEISEAASKRVMIPPPRFPFKIDPMTALEDLLPPLPESTTKLPSVLNEDLALVPELMFAKPLDKKLESFKSQEETAHRMAKINHLNQKSEDGFIKAYLAKRADLRGMPFLMGKECRTDENQAAIFQDVVSIVRAHLGITQDGLEIAPKKTPSKDQEIAQQFWSFVAKIKDGVNAATPPDNIDVGSLRRHKKEDVDRAMVAALTQMMTPMPEPYQLGLAKYLATVKNKEASVALAKLALYSRESKVRSVAMDGLKSREGKDYLETLLAGFRYPLPAVAQRAAEALVKSQNKEVLTELVGVLEQPDPRAPTTKEVAGKPVSFVRELVRVNHHHNCLLCHAPANTPDTPKGTLSAPVPQPGQALPSVFQGYGSRQSPDIFVRTDMNYLRQDFSVMMKVEDATPWPEMQRFDFFVRTRELSAKEAEQMTRALEKAGTSPSHQAAQFALRELTGLSPQDATPAEWRRLLKSTKP